MLFRSTDEITREDPDGREEVFEKLPVWFDSEKAKKRKAPKTKGSEASEKEFEIQKDGGAYGARTRDLIAASDTRSQLR